MVCSRPRETVIDSTNSKTVNHFDRHVGIELRVARAVYLTRPACAEGSHHDVVTDAATDLEARERGSPRSLDTPGPHVIITAGSP